MTESRNNGCIFCAISAGETETDIEIENASQPPNITKFFPIDFQLPRKELHPLKVIL